MDSIVREVVSRSGVEPRVLESPTQTAGIGAEDAELERILASLRTNIKIVGIGGGGCNTIDRLVESGIVGAELFAAKSSAPTIPDSTSRSIVLQPPPPMPTILMFVLRLARIRSSSASSAPTPTDCVGNSGSRG